MTEGAAQDQPRHFPRELLAQSPAARLEYFKAFTVAHPFLQQADTAVWHALREPAGALLIFVIGPTGVGKTTLLTHLEQRLLKHAQAVMARDPDHLPAIRLDAMAPSARQFRWADFYTRALTAVSEPLIDYKVDRSALTPIFNEQLGKHVPPRLVGDAATLQRSWEQVLTYRRPRGILIDEAHHFAKTARGTRLVDQLDHLKSLAIATQTVHVLAGTYDLLIFRNLSAQLSRRSIDVHLPRYRASDKEERLIFQKVLYTFQRHLPLEEPPDLVHQWKYCYSRTIGCVGMLNDWLTKALAEALETGAKTITPEVLERHASTPARCEQMITDIEEGEKALLVDPQAQAQLLARLGLSPRNTKRAAALHAESTSERPPGKSVPARRVRVGQRAPRRDPVKTEVARDG